MNLLLVFKAAVLLAPYARQGIEIAQAMLPEKGQGSARLQIAKAHVKAAADQVKEIADKFDDVWPLVERGISQAVPVLKSLGILKNTGPITAAVDAINAGASVVKAVLPGGSAPGNGAS